MKKILSLLVLAIVAVQFSWAADVITKDMNQLPLPAAAYKSLMTKLPTLTESSMERALWKNTIKN